MVDIQDYKLLEVYPRVLTVPDSFVVRDNKIKTTDKNFESHGEAKLYSGTKEMMREFYGGEGFVADCFMLKSDLIKYLKVIEREYLDPSQVYRGAEQFGSLWEQRIKIVNDIDSEIIPFQVTDQKQIKGSRGYVNSNDFGYRLIRQISLPLVSFILIKKVSNKEGQEKFYWRLYVDFDAIEEMKSLSLVFKYGLSKAPTEEEAKKEIDRNDKIIKGRRDGQQQYRKALLHQCPFCPITRVTDERLLIASHIKPWAASTEEQKIDPFNGFIFTPTYDRLFDQGLITFTNEKCLVVSSFLSPRNSSLLDLKDGMFIQMLPMDEKRKMYLEFHRENVFKG